MIQCGEYILVENLKPLKQILGNCAEGKADRTRSTAQHSIEKFLIWCGNRRISNFTQDDV